MKKLNERKEQLNNIKNYLIENGVQVDEVTLWQGGFNHEGTEYGLDVIARVIINGHEEHYCVPKYLVKPEKEGVRLKWLKLKKD